jgi:hypothetical protein
VHDYFDIIGIPDDASAREIRRACARRTGAGHPDFRPGGGDAATVASPATDLVVPEAADVAIDFVDMTTIVARMQAAFFATS